MPAPTAAPATAPPSLGVGLREVGGETSLLWPLVLEELLVTLDIMLCQFVCQAEVPWW